MYLFKQSKKYDPTPYNWFKHQWHKMVGCDIGQVEISEDSMKQLHLYCDCGRSHVFDVDKDLFIRSVMRKR